MMRAYASLFCVYYFPLVNQQWSSVRTLGDRGIHMRSTFLTAVAAVLVLASLASAGAQDEDAIRTFLPVHEADNLARMRMVVDDEGGIHMALPSITGKGFHYSYCQPGCTGSEQVSDVIFSTEQNGPGLSLALDPQGRPHILIDAYLELGYAWCSGDCTTEAGWNVGTLASYDQPDFEITGDALAIGPEGRVHFLQHARRKILNQEHETWYATCAADCHLAGNWERHLIEPEQSFLYPSLKVRDDGVLTLGMLASANPDLGLEYPLAAYMECREDCSNGSNWNGAGLFEAHDLWWSTDVGGSITLQLTGDGKPRMASLARLDDGTVVLAWMSCDAADCLDGDAWRVEGLVDSTDRSFGSGLHLALDELDRPHIAYTVSSNILQAFCTADCNSDSPVWDLAVIEAGSEIEADDIFLYTNCVFGAWFLKDPQIGLLPGGRIAALYTAEDISFGGVSSDPSKPPCPIGVDMSLGRLSILGR